MCKETILNKFDLSLEISTTRQVQVYIYIYLHPRKNANKCSFGRFLFFERFLQMSVIALHLPFLHFMDVETKIMSVFSREISVNTGKKT